MRFSGSDIRETMHAVCNAEEMRTVDALLRASGSTWEGVAFEARALMDNMMTDHLDEDALEVAQTMFIGGYLSGLAQCVVEHKGDERRAA